MSANKLVDFARAAGVSRAALEVDTLVVQFREFQMRFILHPGQWNAWVRPTSLPWKKVRFRRGSRSKIPAIRGVYCFLARPRASGLPRVEYPLYVGETGDTSKATLATRFGDYLGEAKGSGRGKMFYWLRRLVGHLDFAFVPIPNTAIKLRTVEAQLADALLPPLNKRDFSARVRKAIKVLRDGGG